MSEQASAPSDDYEIVELMGEDAWRRAWPVMSELRTHLDVEAGVDLMRPMGADGYRLCALTRSRTEEIVALAGFAIRTNLYYGRYLYVYDLVTADTERSKGHGRRLLDHLEAIARGEGCDTLALSSGLQRVDAHRFYEDKMGYDRVSYVFRKDL